MEQHIISAHTWNSLSNEQRNLLRTTFDIPRSSHVVVNDGRIETDGTTYEDFKHLTVEKMQEYLHDFDCEDFHKLFDMVLEKINRELNGEVVEQVEETHAKKSKQK